MSSPNGYTPGCVAGLLNDDGSQMTRDNKVKKLFSSPQVSCSIVKKGRSPKKRKYSEKSTVTDTDGNKKNQLKMLRKLAKMSRTEHVTSPEEPSRSGPEETPSTENQSSEGVPDRKLELTSAKRKEKKEKLKRIKLMNTEKNKRSVFIGNLPNTISKKTVKRMLKAYGTVESIRFRSAAPANPKMPKKGAVARRELNSNISSFNAYAVFLEESSARKAVQLNGSEVEGHHIHVDYLGKDKKHNHRKSVFIGNVPFDAEEEELRQHFSECGDIENVRLIRDKFSRLGKGFGYILFEDADSVLLALKLNGEKFRQNSLRIERSTDPSKLQKKKDKTKKIKMPKGIPEKKNKDSKHAISERKQVKKLKEPDSSGSATSRKKLISASKRKEQKKKKLQHRLDRKKKKRIANILTGNPSKISKKQPKKSSKPQAKPKKDHIKKPQKKLQCK